MTSQRHPQHKAVDLMEELPVRSYITGLKLQHALLQLSSRDGGETDCITHSISH